MSYGDILYCIGHPLFNGISDFKELIVYVHVESLISKVTAKDVAGQCSPPSIAVRISRVNAAPRTKSLYLILSSYFKWSLES